MTSLAVTTFLPTRPTVRLGSRPKLSVVVASTGEETRLRACMDALVPVCRELEMEIVVVRDASADDVARYQAAYPRVRFVSAPPGTSSPTLRAIGLAAANGDIVVLTHDDAAAALETVRRRVGSPARSVTNP